MKTILVVDDEPTIRRLIHDVLTDEGYRVSVAATGSEALARSGPEPDLVIADPFFDPERTVFHAGLTKWHGSVPVLIVSGYGELPAGLDELGVSFLRKPFDLDKLVTIVRELTKDGSATGGRATLQ